MGNRMRGMFTKIPENLLEDFVECFHFSTPGNSRVDSEECSARFRGMFQEILNIPGMLLKILGNVPEDSGECSRKFREI